MLSLISYHRITLIPNIPTFLFVRYESGYILVHLGTDLLHHGNSTNYKLSFLEVLIESNKVSQNVFTKFKNSCDCLNFDCDDIYTTHDRYKFSLIHIL